jgi:acetolactate synthase-1/2/3 large subunit
MPQTELPCAWLERCNRWREEFPWVEEAHVERDGFLNTYPFMERLNAHLKPDQLVVTDMGTALLSGLQVLRMKSGQRLMTSTGLGEMGFGLPAAVGASFARDRGEVLCLNCDGGMMMNLQELQTVAHHNLPIKLIIFNNDGYLMIKHTQKAVLQGRYSGTDRKSGVSCPDFSKLATAFGFPSWQIRTWEDFDDIIPKIQAHEGPAICEVFMHPEQLFIPKLGLAPQKDGTLVSPPLEDLSPVLSREKLRENMLVPLHPKSEKLE